MLREQTLLGVHDKVADAIERLRHFEPRGGYYLCFSGGKDSQCIYHLAKEAGVRFDAHYNITGVDPPELVYFIRKHYPDVHRELYKKSMRKLIEWKKWPPTRRSRYCCSELKEFHGGNRFCVTGVRWSESVNRKKNRGIVEVLATSGKKQDNLIFNFEGEVEHVGDACNASGKKVLNPIVDWETEDVWEYLNSRNIPHCCLYNEGFTRLGCIGCPMGGTHQMEKEFEIWPGFKKYYLRAFEKAIEHRKESGLKCTWDRAEQMMDWWIYGQDKNKEKEVSGQIYMFGDDYNVEWRGRDGRSD